LFIVSVLFIWILLRQKLAATDRQVGSNFGQLHSLIDSPDESRGIFQLLYLQEGLKDVSITVALPIQVERTVWKCDAATQHEQSVTFFSTTATAHFQKCFFKLIENQ
jgi:hypothetical protein